MLFTTETLVTGTDIGKPLTRYRVTQIMDRKEQQLLGLYQQKHDAILEKNRQLHELVFRAGHWWLDAPRMAAALQQMQTFIDNIQFNFGEQSPAWQQIRSAEHRSIRRQQLIDALMNYRAERDAWDRLFD